MVENQYPVLTSSQQMGVVLQKDYFADHQVTRDSNIGYYVLPIGYFTYRSRSDNNVFVFNRNNVINKGIISYFYPVFKPRKVDSDFLLYRLNTGMRQQLEKAAEGTGQHVLSLKKFKQMEALFPNFKEQQQIGFFLAKLDKTITLHQRKLDLLKQKKQFFLQAILSQQLRFKEFAAPWEKGKLADYFSERDEKSSDMEILSVSMRNGIYPACNSDRHTDPGASITNYKVVQKGDFVYNSMRLWQGALGASNYEGIVSPAYVVAKPNSNTVSSFFVRSLSSPKMLNIFLRYSQGNSKDTLTLKYPEFAKLTVAVPGRKEQEIISNLFNLLDRLVALGQKQINLLEQLKNYYLQNLFI
ncbi:restriction endonuclease subunit S [Bifidobacterium choloepi]|uniref:restriction endonuclease subunit S n=1 Tax=Bifidobacterium choloepi TaxID=2614131 RepID=UPI002F2B2250